MGLTFLAAGTSVPDLITSVLVAKEGKVTHMINIWRGSESKLLARVTWLCLHRLGQICSTWRWACLFPGSSTPSSLAGTWRYWCQYNKQCTSFNIFGQQKKSCNSCKNKYDSPITFSRKPNKKASHCTLGLGKVLSPWGDEYLFAA